MVYNNKEISKKIPQRYPFLFVDRVLDVCETSAVAIKNVSINDPYLVGHFPGDPVFPGVLLIETCAQVGGIMISENEKYDCKGYIAQVNEFKLLSIITPGDTIYVYTSLCSLLGSFAKIEAYAKVENKIVAKGIITYYFDKTKKIKSNE